MASTSVSFARSIPLAGPGSITRSLSNILTPHHSPNTSRVLSPSEPATPRRLNKHELEARLAHAKVRALARKEFSTLGLGLSPGGVSGRTPRTTARHPALALVGLGIHLSPVPEVESPIELPSPSLPPFSPALAHAGVLSDHERAHSPSVSSTPLISSPLLNTQPCASSPDVPLLPTRLSPATRMLSQAHPSLPPNLGLGLGLGIMLSPLAPPTPKADFDRVIARPKPRVRKSQDDFPRTPGAPLVGCLRSSEGIEGCSYYHLPSRLITPVGLGIDMGAEVEHAEDYFSQ
ncbi:hypothetical protein AcW1_008448 [Taiwanofungus camphoratus]|nr:hypothetical protein AcV5_008742 [Antrodia cinnamomea]KAI0951398.1 hypothetical protein AcW1_008448 [Antrodia cinnamomea]KAI0956301.1 hypothetical protein AcV7_006737 [Antrodia cinnamomea]